MTCLNRFLTCALAGAFATTASCGGDASSPVGPDTEAFDLLTGCSGTCVGGFVTVVDGFDDIMMWLASGTDTTVADRSLNLETGAFGFDLDMDGRSGNEIQFRGTVSPLSRCADGMVKGDVCIAEWDMFHIQTGGRTGEGTFSIIGLGDAAAPYSTPSYRLTIARENTWMQTEDGCRLEVTGLDMIVHPFGDPQLMSAIVTFRMTSEGTVDEVSGNIIYGYDPTATAQLMSLTGQYTVGGTTADFSCSVDLDTFAVSCS